jgi:hypothetical protein
MKNGATPGKKSASARADFGRRQITIQVSTSEAITTVDNPKKNEMSIAMMMDFDRRAQRVRKLKKLRPVTSKNRSAPAAKKSSTIISVVLIRLAMPIKPIAVAQTPVMPLATESMVSRWVRSSSSDSWGMGEGARLDC